MTPLWAEDHLLWVVMLQQHTAEIQRVRAEAFTRYKPSEQNPTTNCLVIERNLFNDRFIP